MVKAYLKYKEFATFGVIASHAAGIVYDQQAHHIISPALEDVLVWNIKKGTDVCKNVQTSSSARLLDGTNPTARAK